MIDTASLQEAFKQSNRLALLTEVLRDHVRHTKVSAERAPHAAKDNESPHLIALASHICVAGHLVVDLFDACFHAGGVGAGVDGPEEVEMSGPEVAVTDAAQDVLDAVETVSLVCRSLLGQEAPYGVSSLAFDRLARRCVEVRGRLHAARKPG